MTERQRLARRKAEEAQKKKIVREAMRQIKLSNASTAAAAQTSPKRSWKMSDGPENSEACFLCTHQRKYQQDVERLLSLLDRIYGLHKNEVVALRLHHYFKDEILTAEMGSWMLTAEMALEHIEGMHILPLDPARFATL
jgi:hypothetical protein